MQERRAHFAQATNEFMAAVEVSENQHPGANKVLALMQSLDDRFWKLDRKNPSKKLLDAYEQKEARAGAADSGDRFKVADWAHKKKLTTEAKAEYLALIRAEDKELTFDREGRVILECGLVPKDISEEIRAAAVVINGKPYLRDEFLALNPDIAVIHESLPHLPAKPLTPKCPYGTWYAADIFAACRTDGIGRESRTARLLRTVDRRRGISNEGSAGIRPPLRWKTF